MGRCTQWRQALKTEAFDMAHNSVRRGTIPVSSIVKTDTRRMLWMKYPASVNVLRFLREAWNDSCGNG
jgi:hypothetical protein